MSLSSLEARTRRVPGSGVLPADPCFWSCVVQPVTAAVAVTASRDTTA
jgi:hypothetical protein